MKKYKSKIFAVVFIIFILLAVGYAFSDEKEEVVERLKSGKIDLIIGTHALLSDNVIFTNNNSSGGGGSIYNAGTLNISSNIHINGIT